MSTPADELPLIAAQDSYIEANLNAILMFSFLMGAYTLVYFGTLRLYYSKNGPVHQRRVVVSTITILYIMCTCTFALNWYLLKYAVIDNGHTDTSTFYAIVHPPPWVYIVLVILQFGIFIISDGLLIWRCFYVWDRSFRVILVPLVFLVMETGFSIATVFYTTHNSQFVSSIDMARLENGLTCTGLFATSATTLLTTSLIGYRIYSATRPVEGTIITSGRRFQHITKVLAESAAVYALIITVNNIFAAIPYGLASTLDVADTYTSLLAPIAGGMAPTMVIARTAIASQNSTQDSISVHVSGLQFQTQPNHNGSGNDHEGELESRIRSGEP